jgi:hypothetical protein
MRGLFWYVFAVIVKGFGQVGTGRLTPPGLDDQDVVT